MTRDQQDDLEAQIARTRRMISLSRRNIRRSQDRIDASLRAMARGERAFEPEACEATDEQQQVAIDLSLAQAQQRQIDHEVRQSGAREPRA